MVITIEKIAIYERFNGDGDGFARGARKAERNSINDLEWGFISEAIQNIVLVRKQLTSTDFEFDMINQLQQNCVNKTVIDKLYQMSDKQM